MIGCLCGGGGGGGGGGGSAPPKEAKLTSELINFNGIIFQAYIITLLFLIIFFVQRGKFILVLSQILNYFYAGEEMSQQVKVLIPNFMA